MEEKLHSLLNKKVIQKLKTELDCENVYLARVCHSFRQVSLYSITGNLIIRLSISSYNFAYTISMTVQGHIQTENGSLQNVSKSKKKKNKIGAV